MGTISVPLVIWDIHNTEVIYSVGMGWDTGAPVWPYRTPEILLWLLNFPAHVIAQPIANLMDLVAPKHHLLLLPSTLLWWWLVGLVLDRQSMQSRGSLRWQFVAGLVVMSATFSSLAAYILIDAFRWWFQYGNGFWNATTFLMLRFLTPVIWFVAFASLIAVCARRGRRSEQLARFANLPNQSAE